MAFFTLLEPRNPGPRCLQGWFLVRTPTLGCRRLLLTGCSPGFSLVCACAERLGGDGSGGEKDGEKGEKEIERERERERESSLVSLLIKTLIPSDQWYPSNLITSLEAPSPNTHVAGASTHEFWGQRFSAHNSRSCSVYLSCHLCKCITEAPLAKCKQTSITEMGRGRQRPQAGPSWTKVHRFRSFSKPRLTLEAHSVRGPPQI